MNIMPTCFPPSCCSYGIIYSPEFIGGFPDTQQLTHSITEFSGLRIHSLIFQREFHHLSHQGLWPDTHFSLSAVYFIKLNSSNFLTVVSVFNFLALSCMMLSALSKQTVCSILAILLANVSTDCEAIWYYIIGLWFVFWFPCRRELEFFLLLLFQCNSVVWRSQEKKISLLTFLK